VGLGKTCDFIKRRLQIEDFISVSDDEDLMSHARWILSLDDFRGVAAIEIYVVPFQQFVLP
jgi:hypothetical protein